MPQGYPLFKDEKHDTLDDKLTLLKDLFFFKPSLKDDLAEDVIKERLTIQKASLAQLLELILEREKIKKGIIASLESEIMGCQSRLYLYQCRLYPIDLDNKRKGVLEKMLSDLEKRRKQEEVDCWKDTQELWRELLRLIAEYRATLRKEALISEA